MKPLKELFNDPLAYYERAMLEQLGIDSRRVLRLESDDSYIPHGRSLVEMGYAEITSERDTVNFKITKKGKEFLDE